MLDLAIASPFGDLLASDEFKKTYWSDKPNRPGAISGQQAFREYLRRQIDRSSSKEENGGDKADDLKN